VKRAFAGACLALASACASLPGEPPRTPPRSSPIAPIIAGNDARILVDGPRTYAAMFAAMERARDHINLETYILEGGEVGGRVAQVVRKKIAQGVKVNILYDSVGSIATPKDYFDQLRSLGAKLCEFNPVNPAKASGDWDINNRNHRKILVVDGRVAFTGGINISSTYSAGSRQSRHANEVKPGEASARGWRDTNVQAEGPIVARFQRVFLDGWNNEDCGPIQPAAYFPRLASRGDQEMQVLTGDPGIERSETYTAVLNAIHQARSRVWITMGYFAPDPPTVEALLGAAHRGVDVRLILPGFSDFWAPVYAARSHYAELLEGGVRIYEWHKALLHAKTVVIDSRWSSIGSTNLDWRSFVHNYEADLEVRDREFGAEMERLFRDDLASSVEIKRDEWRQRGAMERVKEWMARRWEYLL
jgi:cardiolipin synthase